MRSCTGPILPQTLLLRFSLAPFSNAGYCGFLNPHSRMGRGEFYMLKGQQPGVQQIPHLLQEMQSKGLTCALFTSKKANGKTDFELEVSWFLNQFQ